ncbi:uncharacterized protein LOC141933494 [Strix aluco]|uniref:uncharacterized protein LOC141933494 n=1 Tax=Strix aluco TaxID=111821 RepID=UPI003DA328A3
MAEMREENESLSQQLSKAERKADGLEKLGDTQNKTGLERMRREAQLQGELADAVRKQHTAETALKALTNQYGRLKAENSRLQEDLDKAKAKVCKGCQHVHVFEVFFSFSRQYPGNKSRRDLSADVTSVRLEGAFSSFLLPSRLAKLMRLFRGLVSRLRGKAVAWGQHVGGEEQSSCALPSLASVPTPSKRCGREMKPQATCPLMSLALVVLPARFFLCRSLHKDGV